MSKAFTSYERDKLLYSMCGFVLLTCRKLIVPGHPKLHFSSAHFRPDVAQELLGWTFLVFGMVRGAV